ncbi:MAG TPA: protein kinase [Candidatus Angelobacter sp.]|jgi:tRNA A-37 threonylcarbamoyl transferase component Bud32|nr:protein kinase [Candidatus Angelobacter sp.]
MENGTQVGVYKVVKMLGAGGMARVYLAEDSRLGRKVALKVLPADSVQNPERVRRFEQEARAASALNHPNILTIYDIGDVDSTKFIATEFVEGETVRDVLLRPMPLLNALDIGIQVAAALSTAHAAGIVHRDIKPENLMMRPDGFVKVLDFGLAKLTQTSPDSIYSDRTVDVTMPGVVMGTLGYMSPEQLRGQPVDARTDVWSLGAVLYEMVTGKPPFTEPTPTDTMIAVLQRDPPAARRLRIDAPEELERILSKSLAKNADERYQTVKDLAIDLKRLKQRMEAEADQQRTGVGPVPVASHASPVTAPAKKKIAPAMIVFVVLAVLAAIAIVGWVVKKKEPQSAASQRQSIPAQTPPAAPSIPSTPATESRPPGAGAGSGAQTGQVDLSKIVPNVNIPVPGDLGNLGPRKGERELAYSLLVQPTDGAAFHSTGSDPLKSGWKFSINVASSQSGHLYLIDQPENGSPAILYPTAKVNQGASLISGKPLRIGPYTLDANPGKEKLWIVWSSRPVFELQLATDLMKNPAVAQYAGKDSITPQIQSFLRKRQDSSSQAQAQPSGSEVKLISHIDPLVYAVNIEHR